MDLTTELAERLEIADSPGHACDLIMGLLEEHGYQLDRKNGLALWIALLAKEWHDRLPGQYREQAIRIICRLKQQMSSI